MNREKHQGSHWLIRVLRTAGWKEAPFPYQMSPVKRFAFYLLVGTALALIGFLLVAVRYEVWSKEVIVGYFGPLLVGVLLLSGWAALREGRHGWRSGGARHEAGASTIASSKQSPGSGERK